MLPIISKCSSSGYPEEEHFEIIGNIYEHPEILEELKKSAEDKK